MVSSALIYKKAYKKIVSYILSVNILYLVFFTFLATPSSISFLLIYFGLLIISIYEDFILFIISLLAFCGFTNYFYFNYWEFFLRRNITFTIIIINVLLFLFAFIIYNKIKFQMVFEDLIVKTECKHCC